MLFIIFGTIADGHPVTPARTAIIVLNISRMLPNIHDDTWTESLSTRVRVWFNFSNKTDSISPLCLEQWFQKTSELEWEPQWFRCLTCELQPLSLQVKKKSKNFMKFIAIVRDVRQFIFTNFREPHWRPLLHIFPGSCRNVRRKRKRKKRENSKKLGIDDNQVEYIRRQVPVYQERLRAIPVCTESPS